MANIADLQNDQNALVLRTLGAIFAIPNGIEAADPVREQAGQLVALANGPGSEIRDDRIRLVARQGGRPNVRSGADDARPHARASANVSRA